MTRYLDREPQVGDRVHVEFEGVVIGTDDRDPIVRRDRLAKTPYRVDWATTHPAREVRVIAPEAKVGDVVTEDMEELPVGTVLARDSFDEIAKRAPGGWFACAPTPVPPSQFDWGALRHLSGWRIVRIGGGQ